MFSMNYDPIYILNTSLCFCFAISSIYWICLCLLVLWSHLYTDYICVCLYYDPIYILNTSVCACSVIHLYTENISVCLYCDPFYILKTSYLFTEYISVCLYCDPIYILNTYLPGLYYDPSICWIHLSACIVIPSIYWIHLCVIILWSHLNNKYISVCLYYDPI